MQLVKVIISEQKMLVYKSGKVVRTYPVSTSKFGTGNIKNSFMTPPGKHKIIEKIGSGIVIGGVFSGKKYTGKTYHETGIHEEDLITSRILILDGLEPGINKGKGIDSLEREIWIHGTNEENKIGTPASHGCIRMLNSDIIELFDEIEEGTLLEIIIGN